MVVPCHALALTTELPLDLLGAVEYLQWGERRGEYDRGIEEGWGLSKPHGSVSMNVAMPPTGPMRRSMIYGLM